MLVHQLQHRPEANLEQRLDANCDEEAADACDRANREVDKPGLAQMSSAAQLVARVGHGRASRRRCERGDERALSGNSAHQYIRFRVRSSASL